MVHSPSTVVPEAGSGWRERIEARIIPLYAPTGLFHFPLLSRICSHLICPTGPGVGGGCGGGDVRASLALGLEKNSLLPPCSTPE